MSAYRLANPPLDAVARDRSPQYLSHRQPHARPASHFPLQEKDRHTGGKMPPAMLVNPFKISMFQQARRLGEPGRRLLLGTAVHVDFSTRKRTLFTESGLYRDALASLGATARQYRLSALGLHPRTEAVLFYPLAAVGLECTFRHGNSRTPDWQNGVKTNSEYKGRKLIPAILGGYSPRRHCVPSFSPRRHGVHGGRQFFFTSSISTSLCESGSP